MEDAEGRKSKKHDREEEPPGTQLVDPKNPDGLQQIQGLVENLSELRRRKKAKRATTQSPPAPAPAPAPAASEDPLVRNTTTGVGGEVEGGVVYTIARSSSSSHRMEPLKRSIHLLSNQVHRGGERHIVIFLGVVHRSNGPAVVSLSLLCCVRMHMV